MDISIEVLAWRVCGYSNKEAEKKINKEADIEQELFDCFNIDSYFFEALIKALVNFTIPTEAAITKEKYQGFIDVENQHFLYKQIYSKD